MRAASVYVVVAVHNRQAMTRRFLTALQKQTFQNINLVLVDDGSTDNSSEMVMSLYPNATIIRGHGKWWWTGSMRRGVDHVRKLAKKGDYVLCANNDQIAKNNAIEKLIEASRKYGNALVGSVAKEHSNKNKLFDSAYTIDWRTMAYKATPIASKGEYAGPIDVLTCRLTLVPFEVFTKINFDDKRFPHYLGDYDLFLQAKRLGYRLILSYDSIIYDIGGKSGTETTDPLTISQLYHNMVDIRSHSNVKFMVRYVLKNAPKLYYKLQFLVLLFYYYLYLFAKAFLFTFFNYQKKGDG